jgi:hypothetical protein
VLIDNPTVIPKVMGVRAKSSLPIPLQIVMQCVGLLISLVAGNAMLNGRNWARFLYVVWRSIVFVIGILTSPVEIVMIAGQIVGFVTFAAIMFFCLFSPKANEYFSTKEVANNAQGV